jgi:hypothetical protein
MEFLAPETWARIPDRVYEAKCIKQMPSPPPYKKIFLHFQIVTPGEHSGIILFKAYNASFKNEKIPTQGSNYYKDWVMVNNWMKPSRGTKMSPKIFLNKIYDVKTRTVRPKRERQEMPEQFWYSVVDSLVRVIVNRPPLPTPTTLTLTKTTT